MKALPGIWRREPLLAGIIAMLLSACWEEPKPVMTTEPEPEKEPAKIKRNPPPAFDADSAFLFIQKQLDFGPRVPNTESHDKCATYLVDKFENFGWKVNIQKGTVLSYAGKKLRIQNIIGQYMPELTNRVMLCAHWDTRPYADRDSKNRAKPIDGANDGASGVAVLLEVARALGNAAHKPRIGIDIIFFDAEDYGQPQETMISKKNNTWCLGSQYWAKNPPIAGYRPRFGILLDMVGSADAVFPKEGTSMYFAPQVVHKVWAIASELGYGDLFIQDEALGGLTDDHLYINEIARIPCIDIVHYNLNTQDFGAYHHTHKDNINIIDKNTLHAVGTVLLETVYRE